MKTFVLTNQGFKPLKPCIPLMFFSCLWLCTYLLPYSFPNVHATSWFNSNMLVGLDSLPFDVFYFDVLKWRLLICWNHPFMDYAKWAKITQWWWGMLRIKWHWKKIPLVCNPMVTFSTLVSCIINPKKNFDHQLFQLLLAQSFSLRSTNVIVSTSCQWIM